MAVYSLCEREMLEAGSCLSSKLSWLPRRGKVVDYERIRNGEEKRYGESSKCHDCGVMPDGYHHPGCDIEECPRCGCQLILCRCNESGKFCGSDAKTTVMSSSRCWRGPEFGIAQFRLSRITQ